MDITDIKMANKAAGKFFFDRATMRFFLSKTCSTVHEGPGGVFFVTSEQFEDRAHRISGPRLYSVREARNRGADIETWGEFQEYSTTKRAHVIAELLAARLPKF